MTQPTPEAGAETAYEISSLREIVGEKREENRKLSAEIERLGQLIATVFAKGVDDAWIESEEGLAWKAEVAECTIGICERRANLRLCSNMQNQGNSRIRRGKKSSRFKGVTRRRGAWVASIRINKRSKHIGVFSSEVAAAMAYDAVAMAHYGEFAKTNKMLGLL